MSVLRFVSTIMCSTEYTTNGNVFYNACVFPIGELTLNLMNNTCWINLENDLGKKCFVIESGFNVEQDSILKDIHTEKQEYLFKNKKFTLENAIFDVEKVKKDMIICCKEKNGEIKLIEDFSTIKCVKEKYVFTNYVVCKCYCTEENIEKVKSNRIPHEILVKEQNEIIFITKDQIINMLTQVLVEYTIPMNEYFMKKTKIMSEPENDFKNILSENDKSEEIVYEQQVSEELCEMMSECNNLNEKELTEPENVCNKREENIVIGNDTKNNNIKLSEHKNANILSETFTSLNEHKVNEKMKHKDDFDVNKKEKTEKNCYDKNKDDKMLFVVKIAAAVGISCGCLSVIIFTIYLYKRKNAKNVLTSKNNEI